MKYAVAAFLAMMSLVFVEHAPAAEPKAILVFGDSLSEGFMLKQQRSLPGFTCKKAARRGPELFSDQRDRHRRDN